MNKHLETQAPSVKAAHVGSAEFSASVGHELRNPLSAVIAQAESLLDGVYGTLLDRQQTAVTSIQTHVRHTLSLVADLVEVLKLSNASLALVQVPGSVRDLVLESLSRIADHARERSIEITHDVNPSDIHVTLDFVRLKQMLDELLSIAVLVAVAGGRVCLHTTTVDGGLLVRIKVGGEVNDSLPAEVDPEQSPAFRRVKQLKPIGMALLQALIQLHQGRFTVGEWGNHIRTLTLWVPAVETAPLGSEAGQPFPVPAAETAAPMSSAPQASSPLILLADDQPMLLAVTGNYLESRGFRVETARDGMEAVDKALTLRPDLIIMDVLMPVLDGPQAVIKIRSSPHSSEKRVPIICASGMQAVGDREKCLAAGADGYLSKPYGIKDIDKLLSEYLNVPLMTGQAV